MNVDFSDLRLRTSGTGLKLGQDLTESAFFGNSVFNMVRVGLSATDAIGLDLSSASGTYTPIFLTFNGFQVTGGNQDGTIGIKIRGPRESAWFKTYIEQVATGIDVAEASGGQHSYDLEFFATTVRVGSGRTCLKVGTDVYALMFFGGLFSTSGTWVDYDSSAYNAGTKFHNFSFEGGGSMSISGDEWIQFHDCEGYSEPYESVNADPWPNPSGHGWNGRRAAMYNAHATFSANPHRLYIYSNGGWHYEILT
jgi:hypothetical protein